VATTDALVEGVHFDRAFTPPWAIGHRALAVNLSDLAAMGASPRSALLSLVLPPGLRLADFDAMVDGFMGLAAAAGVALIGGNITRSPGPLIVDVTAMGTVRRRRVLARSGARPGDEVWVSGDIGSAAAGMQSLRAGSPDGDAMSACEAAFLEPQPRLRLGTLLGRNRAATSCVDLSDGLADGLHQLAGASGVGVEVDGAAVPVSAGARAWFDARGLDPVTAALAGGDDYELLFTVRPRARSRFETVRRQSRGLRLTKIGTVRREAGVIVTRGGVAGPAPSGYVHFR
jgi:thiamine-monophosphate kinase